MIFNDLTFTFLIKCGYNNSTATYVLVKINEIERYFLICKNKGNKNEALLLDQLEANTISNDIIKILDRKYFVNEIIKEMEKIILPVSIEKDIDSMGNVLLKTALHDRNFNIIFD